MDSFQGALFDAAKDVRGVADELEHLAVCFQRTGNHMVRKELMAMVALEEGDKP